MLGLLKRTFSLWSSSLAQFRNEIVGLEDSFIRANCNYAENGQKRKLNRGQDQVTAPYESMASNRLANPLFWIIASHYHDLENNKNYNY